jgi:hypothetical protein
MPRIAITGHMNLTEETAQLIKSSLEEALTPYPPGDIVGLSCIARGADSIFAEAVLSSGGTIEVFLPAIGYRESKVKSDHREQFDRLVRQATAVHVMPYTEPNREAYEAANEALLAGCDRLYAVWDGQPASDQGGTGAVVDAARRRGIPVTVFWPPGARRG